jgi:hypothetical protein
MSATKIVIIVLVLIGVIFVVFIARGALRDESAPKSDQSTAAKTRPPDWTKTIKGLFKSFQPALELNQSVYTTNVDDEPIKPDPKHPFRTAKFHRSLTSGPATITFKPIGGSPLKDMKDPQVCNLPNLEDGVEDPDRCSIVAFKLGGTLEFKCTGNVPCRVTVEKD